MAVYQRRMAQHDAIHQHTHWFTFKRIFYPVARDDSNPHPKALPDGASCPVRHPFAVQSMCGWHVTLSLSNGVQACAATLCGDQVVVLAADSGFCVLLLVLLRLEVSLQLPQTLYLSHRKHCPLCTRLSCPPKSRVARCRGASARGLWLPSRLGQHSVLARPAKVRRTTLC